MGDISTWNPIDNANTAAPPDGWPEGQSPSSVNNCARAMMGAVRRWYDTVTAQISGMLPLTGGTITGSLGVTGGVTASSMHSTGGLTVDGATTLAGVNAVGVTATSIHSTGGLTVDGATTLAGVNAVGVTATSMHSTGGLTVDGGLSAVNINASGTVTAAQLTSTGNINAAGTVTGTSFIGNISVPAGGPISTTGTITGGDINATGNIAASNGILGRDIEASNTLLCGPGGSYLRADIGGTYNISGAWIAVSDRGAKQEATIAPYERGLEAIMALRPCAYRYRPELFGAEEAEKTRYGLVADEVAPVVPEMVGQASFGGRDLSTLNTGHISLVLLNACRELAEQNAALAARITALEGH